MSQRLSLMPWNLRELFPPRKKLALKNTVRLAEVVQRRSREDKFPQIEFGYFRRKEPLNFLENRTGCRETAFE